MLDKVLIVLGEVYLGLRSDLLPPIIQAILVDHQVFIVMVITEVDIGITPDNCSTYNHDEVNISHLRCPQEDIRRGVHGESLHQNRTYYSYTSMPTHPHTIMPQYPHHKIPPHLYPSIPPHKVFLFTYYTYTPMYSSYSVPNYLHIISSGYIHT